MTVVDRSATPRPDREQDRGAGRRRRGQRSSARYDGEPMTVESPPRSCPRCEATVAADAKFCANCGQALEPAADGRTTRRDPRPPDGRRARRRSSRRCARRKLTGERKPVTALFADVVGSTTLAEHDGPGGLDGDRSTRRSTSCRAAVFRYEGTIAQLQGDAMLAFFGAPVAHEDDPERAILAALDMLDAIDEFARQLKATHGIDFRIRAGINSGPVMVGNVGSRPALRVHGARRRGERGRPDADRRRARARS